MNSLKQTLENLEGKVNDSGFFQNLWTSVKNFFTGGSNSGDGGIINDTKDEVLGENAVIDSTLEASGNDSETDEDKGGFWDKVTGFFKNLFGGNDKDEDESKEDSETEENSENDIENDSEASDGTDQPVDTAGNLDSEGMDGTDNETAPADEGALNASDNPPNAEVPNNDGVDTANTDTDAADTNLNDNTGDAQ